MTALNIPCCSKSFGKSGINFLLSNAVPHNFHRFTFFFSFWTLGVGPCSMSKPLVYIWDAKSKNLFNEVILHKPTRKFRASFGLFTQMQRYQEEKLLKVTG